MILLELNSSLQIENNTLKQIEMEVFGTQFYKSNVLNVFSSKTYNLFAH